MKLPRLRTHEKKLKPKVETQQEIWESFAKLAFPTLNEQQLVVLKMEAATEWLMDADTEKSRVYDQYVMMKNLLGVQYES